MIMKEAIDMLRAASDAIHRVDDYPHMITTSELYDLQAAATLVDKTRAMLEDLEKESVA